MDNAPQNNVQSKKFFGFSNDFFFLQALLAHLRVGVRLPEQMFGSEFEIV